MFLHKSPGLAAVYNEIKSSQRNRVLDLGPMVAANFSFFSQLSCKIHFENLDEFIQEYGKLSTQNLIYRLERYLLAHKEGEKFDVILSWDIFNYLELEAVQALLEKLKQHCKPDTLLHMFKYVSEDIPVLPRKFSIKDTQHVAIDTVDMRKRHVPQHNTSQLLKKIPEYYLQSTVVGMDGMHSAISEYVLRFQPNLALRKKHATRTEVVQATSSILTKGLLRHHSPALESVISYLRHRKGTRVLDLGLKNSKNANFWQQYADEVYSEDLISSLRWWRSTQSLKPGDNGYLPISPQLLSYSPDVKFDVILGWDIFNYCSQHQLRALGERLNAYCTPQTKLLCFMYPETAMPAKPGNFLLRSPKELVYSKPEKLLKVKNAATSASLMKLMAGFGIRNTFIQRPGMQKGITELLFEYRGNLAARVAAQEKAS